MKLKIKVKEITEGCMPEIIEQGDWIDLKLAEDVKFTGPEVQSRKIKYLPLGIAMELPKGFEAYVLPRSSTPLLNSHLSLVKIPAFILGIILN